MYMALYNVIINQDYVSVPYFKVLLYICFHQQAIVFDNEHDAFDAIMARHVKEGQVLVIRYEGPKGRCVLR